MGKPQTVSREQYGLTETILNGFGQVLQALKCPLTSLDAQSIKRRAEKHAKLSDWGDPRHQEALEQLVAMVSQEELARPTTTNLIFGVWRHSHRQTTLFLHEKTDFRGRQSSKRSK